MVRSSPGAAAPSMRDHGRSRSDWPVSGAEDLSDPGTAETACSRQRSDTLEAAAERGGAELHFNHNGFRHPGRYHIVGIGLGDVLSGRRRDRRTDAGIGVPARIAPCSVLIGAYLWGLATGGCLMSTLKPLQIDIVSDVVCPWCYIGKRRIENALAL